MHVLKFLFACVLTMVFQTIVQPLQQVSKNQFGWSSSHTHDTSYPERNFVVDGKIVVDLLVLSGQAQKISSSHTRSKLNAEKSFLQRSCQNSFQQQADHEGIQGRSCVLEKPCQSLEETEVG